MTETPHGKIPRPPPAPSGSAPAIAVTERQESKDAEMKAEETVAKASTSSKEGTDSNVADYIAKSAEELQRYTEERSRSIPATTTH